MFVGGWILAAALLAIATEAQAASLTFTPRVSVTEEYNDNIDLDRRNKKDDFITTVTAGGTLEWLGSLSGLRLAYDPGYAFYADHDEFKSWRHSLNAAAWHNFSRTLRLDVVDNFLYSKDPTEARDVLDEQGRVIARGDDRNRERATFYRNVAVARLTNQFGRENSAYAQMKHGLYRYNERRGRDSQEFSPSAGMTAWFSAWTGVEIEAAYTRGLYDERLPSDFNNYLGRIRLNRRVSPSFGLFAQYLQIYRDFDESRISAKVDPDYLVYAPSAGLFYQFDPTLTASLGAGFFYQEIQNDDDEKGPYLLADLNKIWETQRWNLRARLSSGIDSQDFTSDARGFERYGQAELSGLYNFTRELFGDCRLRYRYSDFIASRDDLVDHRYEADAGFGYRIARWMTLRLAYRFNKLDAINSTDDYVQHRVYATVTLEPDQPWRLWD